MISPHGDLSGCSENNPKRDYRTGEVIGMDETNPSDSRPTRPMTQHSKFAVWQQYDEQEVCYAVTFTNRVVQPDFTFSHATEAILFALREVGEIKTT